MTGGAGLRPACRSGRAGQGSVRATKAKLVIAETAISLASENSSSLVPSAHCWPTGFARAALPQSPLEPHAAAHGTNTGFYLYISLFTVGPHFAAIRCNSSRTEASSTMEHFKPQSLRPMAVQNTGATYNTGLFSYCRTAKCRVRKRRQDAAMVGSGTKRAFEICGKGRI